MEEARDAVRNILDSLVVDVDVIYLQLQYKLEAIRMEAKCEVKRIIMGDDQ